MLFIVGTGRSGTTLLRMMMDSHPDLCIAPETHWLRALVEQIQLNPDNRSAIRRLLTSTPNWGDMGIDSAKLDRLLAQHTGVDFVLALYRAYAERTADKATAALLGDKTPQHGQIMTTIASLLPEAHFVHIIRDGRDVAMSHRDMWFGPGRDPQRAAEFWASRIRETRRQGQLGVRYMELSYERLLIEPRAAITAVDAFIGLRFHENQLNYAATAERRLAEFGDVRNAGVVTPASMRRSAFRLTTEPIEASRIGRWRNEMSAQDVAAYERVAGPLLEELGYQLSTK